MKEEEANQEAEKKKDDPKRIGQIIDEQLAQI